MDYYNNNYWYLLITFTHKSITQIAIITCAAVQKPATTDLTKWVFAAVAISYHIATNTLNYKINKINVC